MRSLCVRSAPGSPWRSMALLRSLLGVKRGLDCVAQVAGLSFAPEMSEVEGRLLANHVIVKGHDLDAALAQSPQHRLHFLGGHDEVTIYCGELVVPGKRSPGRQDHRAAHLDLMHGPVARDGHLDHALLGLAFVAE